MNVKNIFIGNKKNLTIGALWLLSFFILLPNFIHVVSIEMAPYTENEVVITNVFYQTELDDEKNLINAQLFQPSPRYGNQSYPAIIACHGWLFGIGKESMHRWSVEISKRGFVVLSIDLPGQGMSIGEKDVLPRENIEPIAIKDGINYLNSLDFVDNTSIGLIGISYGGATVSMSAGVLGDMIDATISINGFTNFTNWLIEGILPELNVSFTVDSEYITLQKVGKTEITKDNIVEILKIYEIYRGSDEDFKALVVSGTNKLDRSFLKKYDAVEQLPNARDDSVLFLHSKRDSTFSRTNQSYQGYKAIINSGKQAHYVLVDDNHQLMGDPTYTSDYIIINFLEEKLKKVDLGSSWNSDYEKYTQKRDIQLTIANEFNFELFNHALGLFIISILPFFVIVNMIFYNKKVETKRAVLDEKFLKRKEESDIFFDFSFGRGSYPKTVIFLILLYIAAYVLIIGVSLGLFTDLMTGMMGALFYFLLYIALYFLPDQAEIDLWKQLNKNQNPYQGGSSSDIEKRFDKKTLHSILIILLPVAVGTIVGFIISPLPGLFEMPIEQIMIPMLIMGIIFIIGGVTLIYYFERTEKEGIKFNQMDWKRFGIDNYSLLKNIAFGSVLFLNFFVQWTIWAYYMKFPMLMGPHSLNYMIVLLATAFFFGGVQLIVKIFKEKVLKDKIEVPTNDKGKLIFIELIGMGFGTILYYIIIQIAFIPLLSFSLVPGLASILAVLFIVIYVFTTLLKVFCVERGVFGYTIFFPMLIFAILAFFLHI